MRPTEKRLTPAMTWGGVQNAGGSGTRPYKRARSGGPDRPSPLEKGAVAAKGGDWGFLLSCRSRGEEQAQRNPPSRLRRATSLFKGGFERGGALMGMPAPAFGGVLRGVRRAGPGGDPRGTAKNFEARNPLGHSALRCFFNLRGKIF